MLEGSSEGEGLGKQEVDAIEMFQNILLGVALLAKNNNRYFND